MTQLQPFYKEVQAHYDLSNDFFALFLGPTMMYTCAYFAREDMSLEEAQRAKIDLLLGKCDLQPGQRLLDVGCGWGTALKHAVEHYGVRGVGITLSREQCAYAQQQATGREEDLEYRLQGWEEFDEPVDRIMVICATEHFREERYAPFFEMCHRILPPAASMVIQAIVFPEYETAKQQGLNWTHEDVLFAKFISTKIFPGGQLRSPSVIGRYAEQAGFRLTQLQSLQPHYAKTLDRWASALDAHRAEALRLTTEETYDMYMKYLTGCANYYRSGHIDVVQMSLCKS